MADESKTRVTILTRSFRIKGCVEITASARVTDYLIDSKDFIAVTEAEVWELGGRQVLVGAFINVSRRHIQVVAPED